MSELGFGVQLTVVGMGLVFAVLVLLWGLLALLLRLDRPPVERRAEPAVRVLTDGVEPELLAAITVAVLTHWAVRRRQAAPLTRSYLPGSQLFASRWLATGRAQQNRSWQRRG